LFEGSVWIRGGRELCRLRHDSLKKEDSGHSTAPTSSTNSCWTLYALVYFLCCFRYFIESRDLFIPFKEPGISLPFTISIFSTQTLLQLKTRGAINTHGYYFGAFPFPNYIRASPWKIACLACRIPNNARLSHHAFMKTFSGTGFLWNLQSHTYLASFL
jgi:hypothetical protein